MKKSIVRIVVIATLLARGTSIFAGGIDPFERSSQLRGGQGRLDYYDILGSSRRSQEDYSTETEHREWRKGCDYTTKRRRSKEKRYGRIAKAEMSTQTEE